MSGRSRTLRDTTATSEADYSFAQTILRSLVCNLHMFAPVAPRTEAVLLAQAGARLVGMRRRIRQRGGHAPGSPEFRHSSLPRPSACFPVNAAAHPPLAVVAKPYILSLESDFFGPNHQEFSGLRPCHPAPKGIRKGEKTQPRARNRQIGGHWCCAEAMFSGLQKLGTSCDYIFVVGGRKCSADKDVHGRLGTGSTSTNVEISAPRRAVHRLDTYSPCRYSLRSSTERLSRE